VSDPVIWLSTALAPAQDAIPLWFRLCRLRVIAEVLDAEM
jgi:hypothetical protein